MWFPEMEESETMKINEYFFYSRSFRMKTSVSGFTTDLFKNILDL